MKKVRLRFSALLGAVLALLPRTSFAKLRARRLAGGSSAVGAVLLFARLAGAAPGAAGTGGASSTPPRRPAAGQIDTVDSQIVIRFQVDAEQAPTHVCFLSDWWDEKWVTTVRSTSDVTQEDLHQWAREATAKVPLSEPIAALASRAEANLLKRFAYRPVEGCTAGEPCAPRFPFYKKALELWQGVAEGAPAPATQAERLVCSAEPTDRAVRIAVLRLTGGKWAKSLSPQLKAPRVLGSTVVALGLTNIVEENQGDLEKVGVSVIGGDYLVDTPAGANVGGRVTLRLVPRCEKRTIEVPAGVPGASMDVYLSTVSEKEPICRDPKLEDHRFFQAWLPNYPQAELRSLTLRSTARGAAATAVDTWRTRESPEVVRPRARSIEFAWRPDCMYSGKWMTPASDAPSAASAASAVGGAPKARSMLDVRTCPDARLAGGAVSCTRLITGAEDGLCHYRCGDAGTFGAAETKGVALAVKAGAAAEDLSCWGRSGKPGDDPTSTVSFDLPVRAQLCRGGADYWEEDLSYSGQELSGFVPPEQRHVEVDFSEWDVGSWWEKYEHRSEPHPVGFFHDLVIQRPAAAIRYVILRDPGGALHQVAPAASQRVLIPGARCGEILTYDIVGDRSYSPGYVTIEHGRVVLQHPTLREERFGYWAWLGGALTTDVVSQNGWFQAERRGYHNSKDWRAGGSLHAGLWIRGLGWPLALEVGLVYMLGQQVYFPIRTNDTETVESRDVLYSHLGAETTVSFFPPCDARERSRIIDCKNVAFGVGAGFLNGYPLLTNDDLLVGGVQLLPTATAHMRWYWSRYFSLQAMGRLVFGEKIRYHAFAPDRAVSTVTDDVTMLQLELGIRVGL